MKSPPANPMRILAVDDDPGILDLYRKILCPDRNSSESESKLQNLAANLFSDTFPKADSVSFNLTLCHQGDEAVDAVRVAIEENRPFAVTFLDVRMPPGPDGVWTAEQIRALDSSTEIVIVTAYSDVDPQKIASRVQPAGKLLYLQKPFHPHEIEQFAAALSAKWNTQKQLHQAQKMEAIGILAGGVAHDLNNVLLGLVSYPELLLMQIPDESPLRKPILTIQKSGEKAAAIVQDLLTLARRGVTVTEVVNLNHIISEYLRSPEYEKLKSYHPKVEVETDLAADLLNILGSPVHLSKTVMNLVSNAAEAMSEGGKISLSTENRCVDRPIRGYHNVDEDDYVVFTVSDTGIGIPPGDMERIFEPFYTKKVMGRSGTGLGMAVVWGTVKDHKGYIGVQSTVGKGTTFTLYFPQTRKKVAKEEPSLSIEDYKSRGESILVVDDVAEQRDIASRILKELDYSVRAVSSGEEAIDYLKDNPADLLVLDMIMDPGIDGYETYKKILEFHPDQKAIIVSGFSETERVKDTQRLGAGAYVEKPFLLEKIGRAIRGELDE